MNELNFTPRLLLGPGPSAVHPRVLLAMARPTIGYLDPQFFAIMDQVQRMLRGVFETANPLTLAVSGTGSAGMEAALSNFIEPGDSVVVGVNGFFSQRMCEMASRYGAEVRRIEKAWGSVFALDEVQAELRRKPVKLAAFVHAETSTGALQPLQGLGKLVHAHGGLLLLDCVTSLGGMPVGIDENEVDIAYSGTQKCLGVPPGLAPLTVSPRAEEILRARTHKNTNWYLDLTLLSKYWGKERTYHHTVPINMVYGLYEGLQMVFEEGLQARWLRHRQNAEWLWRGLEQMDLHPFVPLEHRLPSLTTVSIPQGVDDLSVRRNLLNEMNIEIAGGFGPLAGKIWRIGLMGHSARRENVALLLAALATVLERG